MRWLNYTLSVCILLVSHGYCAHSEARSIDKKDYQLINVTEEDDENTKEIRIRKDEFDEIVGQLQGMKTLLENMKQNFDSRLTEMQEKIVTLEKEKKQLESDTLAVANVNTNASNVAETKIEEKPMTLPADTNTNSPPPPQTTTDSTSSQTNTTAPDPLCSAFMKQKGKPTLSQTNTTATDPPISSGLGTWSPAQPLTIWSVGKSYMNISFDSLFSAGGSTAKDLGTIETGGHDPNQRGFTAQNLEAVFEGAVDPYFKGLSVLVFQIDKHGESFLEVEESYLTTMSLPCNLQVKAGTFFTEFGRLNPTHPHTWDFADQPLVNGRFLGPDGLRNPGARISWLAPLDNYTELFFTVQDSQGGTAYSFRNTLQDSHGNPIGLFGRTAVDAGVRSMGDMLYVPRATTSFDLTDEQTLLLGASAAFGPNSTGSNENTLIYGLDMFWKWKSKHADAGFPFVTWQTEVMERRFEAGADMPANLPAEVMNNWGAYSQVGWGFKKRWVAGLRGDYADREKYAVDASGLERWRLSPNLTFYPSEFSKIRLQYNYDDILGNNTTEHSVFLQFEFLMGSHGAHKF